MTRVLKHSKTYSAFDRTTKHIAICFVAICIALFATKTAYSQENGWSNPITTSISVGGVSGRPTPAAVVFNGAFVVAYTSPTGPTDPNGNDAIYVGQCSGTSCGTFSQVSGVYSNANPSLAVLAGTVYLAFNAATGAGGTATYVTTSTDGVTWSTPTQVIGTFDLVDYSPNLVSDGSGYIYMGLRQHSTETMILCVYSSSNPIQGFSCAQNTTAAETNYQPGLAIFNDQLYIGYVTNSDSHDMYYYVQPDDGSNVITGSVQTGLSGSQSSCAPHLVLDGSGLDYDVRTNDDAHKFSQRYTSDGSDWSSLADAHIAMQGEPYVVNGAGLSGSDSGYLYLFYTTNDSNDYLTVARRSL